jgi:hypothetical protein
MVNKDKIRIMICAIAGVMITWIINHQMGYGPIIANGMVGVVAGALLPGPLAGVMYTASFVGMSGLGVIPSLLASLIGGIVVGTVIIYTPEIYAGIGGKGGTTAAVSGQITRALINIIT